MPVDIEPPHTKTNLVNRSLAVELAGSIFEPHEAVEYRTSSHNISCSNLAHQLTEVYKLGPTHDG